MYILIYIKRIDISFDGILGKLAKVIEGIDNAYNTGIVILAGAGNGGDVAGEGIGGYRLHPSLSNKEVVVGEVHSMASLKVSLEK